MMHLWDSWILMAFVAPAFWAVANMFDAYCVESIYADEYAAAFLSGVFQLLPWLAVLWLGAPSVPVPVAALAIAAGMLIGFSNFFYFKSIFLSGDVAFIQILWNGTAIATPVIAFLVSGERLSGIQYLGIIVVFSGATLMSWFGRLRGGSKRQVVRHMILAVLLLSTGLVAESKVYQIASFFEGLLLSTVGGFLAGSICILWRTLRRPGSRLIKARGVYWVVFLGTEVAALVALVSYQRAISLSPSVSFIAVVESFLPAFVMVYSAIVCLFASAVGASRVRDIYAKQIARPALKIIAISIMSIGILIMG